MNKHLLIALLLSASYQAPAAVLCGGVFKAPPTSEQIDKTLQSLAEMKLELDLAKSEREMDTVEKVKLDNFIAKKEQIQRELSLSESDLRKELSKRISVLQEKRKGNRPQEKQIRHQEDVRLKPYKMINSQRVKNAESDYRFKEAGLSRDHSKMIVDSTSYPDSIYIFDLKNNTQVDKYPAQDHLHVSKDDKLLILNKSEFSLLDLSNLKKTRIHFKNIEGKDLEMNNNNRSALQLSHDQKKVLVTKGEFFFLYDFATQKLIEQKQLSDFPGFNQSPRQAAIDAHFLTDTLLTVTANGSIFTFDTATQGIVKIAENPSYSSMTIREFPERDFLVIQTVHQITLFDKATREVVSRSFNFNINNITVGPRPDTLLVTSSIIGTQQVHELNLFTLASTGTEPETFDLGIHKISPVPGQPYYMVLSNAMRIPTDAVGLYTPDNFKEAAFDFEARYYKSGTLRVEAQAISPDGTKIINLVKDTDGGYLFDTWESNR